MVPKAIKENIQDFIFHPDRLKASGRMWGGSATSIVNGHTIALHLWYHGRMKETAESLKEHLTMLTVNDKSAYWNCLWDDEELFCHPTGWFSDDILEECIPACNPNFEPRMLPKEDLRELGFIKLI